MTHDIFICYSIKDKDFALKACHVFEQNKLRCWIAPRNIVHGQGVIDQINKAITDAKVVVLIASRNNYESEFVGREIDIAMNLNKPIVQLNIDDCTHTKLNSYRNNVCSVDISGKSEEEYYRDLVLHTLNVKKRIDVLGNLSGLEIFISYASEDVDFAHAICRDLKMVAECLFAPEGWESCEDYSNKIGKVIDGADGFILVGSMNAYNSSKVRDEIGAAVAAKKPMVMLRVDEDVPEDLEFYFKNFEWVETLEKSETEYHEDLFDALTALLDNKANEAEIKFDAFISYSTKDKDFADKVCHELESKGCKCWIAPRNIESGMSFADQIQNAIRFSRSLVLIFSQNSKRSKFVQNEISTAGGLSRDIISIRLDSSLLDDDFSDLLQHARWFDSYSLDFDELVESIYEIQDGDENAESSKYLDDLIHSGADEIVLNSDIVLEKSIELDVDDIVIDGNNHVIRATGKSRIFNVTANNVTIKNIIFKDGFGDLGGAIYNNEGDLTVIDCEFLNNSVLEAGGALASLGKTLLKGCVFKFNTSEDGGAVMQIKNKLTCENCIFEYNSADFGGALGFISNCILTDCSFSNNTSNQYGTIQSNNGVLVAKNCMFKNNSSKFCSVIASSATINMYDCTFEGNVASYGALYSEGGIINCVDATFKENSGKRCSCISGSSDIKVVNSEFSNNHSPVIENDLKMNIIDCIFSENHFDDNSLILNNEKSELYISGGKIMDNQVKDHLILSSGKLSIDNLIFEDNVCENAVLNKNEMNLSGTKFKGTNGAILNENCIFIKKLSESEIQERIVNVGEGYIETFEVPEEEGYDFGFLDNLIKKTVREGDSLIRLSNDIILENYEQDFFEGGIDIDVDNITIDGCNKSIDGKNRTRIFNISSKNVTLKNIIFKNGFCENNLDIHAVGGGAIRNIKGSDVVIENCSFINNCSNDDAGAILNNGRLKSINNIFRDNSSAIWGGAILNNGVIHIAGDEYVKNSSKMAGAVYNRNEMHLENQIKTEENTSDMPQPILNANILKLEKFPIDFDKVICNTGEINPVEADSFDTMKYLACEVKNSNQITLEHDIIHEHDLRLKDITIDDDCEIDGKGHVIDFKGISFNFIVNAKVTFKNIIFKNAYVLEESLFKINGEAIFKNAKFLNNILSSKSFLIDVNEKSHLMLIDSDYLNNSSKENSLIRNRGACEISNCLFVNNDSQAKGTVMSIELNNESENLIDSSIFKYNSSGQGVLFNDIWTILKIQNSKLIKNTAEKGGALACNGKLDLENCSFIQNFAVYGGAIYTSTHLSNVAMRACEFKSNHANYGGAVFNEGEIIFNECHFLSNIADEYGGAIYKDANALFFNCTLEENAAQKGGAIHEASDAKLVRINTKFNQNVPDDIG